MITAPRIYSALYVPERIFSKFPTSFRLPNHTSPQANSVKFGLRQVKLAMPVKFGLRQVKLSLPKHFAKGETSLRSNFTYEVNFTCRQANFVKFEVYKTSNL
ncbi:MAG: hypothetical protein IKU07_09075 [Oscillospiraceae bacterium]|nr:hypothetical protein [Oscillospiraceae bacterium]